MMTEKKIYEEAKIEVIEFDCKDILTTSEAAKKERSESGRGGNIKFEEQDL